MWSYTVIVTDEFGFEGDEMWAERIKEEEYVYEMTLLCPECRAELGSSLDEAEEILKGE